MLTFKLINQLFLFLKQREQLASHEEQVAKIEDTVADHKRGSVPTKGLALQNYREKEAYLQYEVIFGFVDILIVDYNNKHNK